MGSNVFGTYFLILLLHLTDSKDIIENDGIPKHWKQYSEIEKILDEQKLRAQNKNESKLNIMHHQQPNLNIHEDVPNHLMKKIAHQTLKSNLSNTLNSLDINNKKNTHKMQREKEYNVAENKDLNTKTNNVNFDLKTSEKEPVQNKSKQEDAKKLELEFMKNDYTNTSIEIEHLEDNIAPKLDSLVTKEIENVRNSSKNTELGTSKVKDENEHRNSYVDEERTNNKLDSNGNESTEINSIREEPIQKIDDPDINIYKVNLKTGDFNYNNRKLYPNWAHRGWIRYIFMPNQYSLSDRGNYMNKVNLYMKDIVHPTCTQDKFRRDLKYWTALNLMKNRKL